MVMKIYNSYNLQVEDFVPVNGNKVNMYVCGPTVYDFPHLGHARCYITWDMVYRYLQYKGYDVTYARNITDVDDKIIKKAKENNTTPESIAATYYKEFKRSMNDLNILDPDIEPMATKNIGEMIKLVKTLIDKGFAYAVDGDVYFRVKKFERYGYLSKQPIEDLESGARIEASNIKEDPLDFALWKSINNEDEITWNSPWGKGRPGWHLECSAMINKEFKGETIDIHAGGQDLLFPHHENEVAQSECANDKQFSKYWMHNGFVTINAEKMSKSLGNFVSIGDMLEKYDANTIRFFILTNHYRMPVGFTGEALDAAKAGVSRLKNAYDDVINAVKENLSVQNLDSITDEDVKTQIQLFTESMDDDFNTAKALACLFELASIAQVNKDSNKDKSSQSLGTLVYLSNILGFNLTKKASLSDADKDTLKSLIVELTNEAPTNDDYMATILELRKQAREEKNWALSDKIRDELANLNITVKDTKEGTTWSVE